MGVTVVSHSDVCRTAGTQLDGCDHRTQTPTLFGSKIISSVFFTFKAWSSESQQTPRTGRSYCKERSKHSSILKSNCVDEHTEQGSTVEMTRLRFVTFSWELMRTFFFYDTFTSFCHFNFQAEPNVCS